MSSDYKTYPKKGCTLGNVSLTSEEQEHLQNVLKRYDEFKEMEEMRIK